MPATPKQVRNRTVNGYSKKAVLSVFWLLSPFLLSPSFLLAFLNDLAYLGRTGSQFNLINRRANFGMRDSEFVGCQASSVASNLLYLDLPGNITHGLSTAIITRGCRTSKYGGLLRRLGILIIEARLTRPYWKLGKLLFWPLKWSEGIRTPCFSVDRLE